ncbi:MAG: sensor histidine kinase, partial [Acidimicrobiia bacterium]|nr:sensor histidine kinase [Acidimicrobiia bacterium]
DARFESTEVEQVGDDRCEAVRFAFDRFEEVLSDPSLVDRILANLVDNALKWSDESDVAVRVHQSGNYVQVHVVDHGPGIPQALKQRVREPFHRVDDKVQSGGLGLGLAIADRLAESIGGRLELRDTPGGGLTAVVFLPIARRSMP